MTRPAISEPVDWSEFNRAFHEAASAAGFIPERLWESTAGPITVWEKPGSGPRVYLSAGMHGDEPAGPFALLALLESGFFTAAARWSLCPTLNPTGLAACTRENDLGTDLNRDYWLRSTPEVLAHAAWLDRTPPPDLFISLHEDWETHGFYFYEINLGPDTPDRAHRILQAVEPVFPRERGPLIDGHDVREDGWIYHAAEPDLPEGWPEAIYLAKLGCPLSFTFETPSRADIHHRIAAHSAGVKAACAAVLPPTR